MVPRGPLWKGLLGFVAPCPSLRMHCHPAIMQRGCSFATDPGPTTATGTPSPRSSKGRHVGRDRELADMAVARARTSQATCVGRDVPDLHLHAGTGFYNQGPF